MSDHGFTAGDLPTGASDRPTVTPPREGVELSSGVGSGGAGGGKASAAAVAPGDVLAERYEVREMLGAGGMGAVYRVHDRVRGRDVALKVAHPALVASSKAVDRFRHEAEVLLGLAHPAIVRVFDVGHDPKRELRFFTMELLAGRTLRSWLRERGRASPGETVAIAAQVLDALAYAHETTIHRDLKPENIWLLDALPAGGPRVKVLDFGIAKLVEGGGGLTATSSSLGTAFYMAPEQRDSAATVDARADLFSLSVVLYEMLTGEVPAGRFPAPREVNPAVPGDLDALVLAGLSRRPGDRPASAEEYRAALPAAPRAPTTATRPAATTKPAAAVVTMITPPPRRTSSRGVPEPPREPEPEPVLEALEPEPETIAVPAPELDRAPPPERAPEPAPAVAAAPKSGVSGCGIAVALVVLAVVGLFALAVLTRSRPASRPGPGPGVRRMPPVRPAPPGTHATQPTADRDAAVVLRPDQADDPHGIVPATPMGPWTSVDPDPDADPEPVEPDVLARAGDEELPLAGAVLPFDAPVTIQVRNSEPRPIFVRVLRFDPDRAWEVLAATRPEARLDPGTTLLAATRLRYAPGKVRFLVLATTKSLPEFYVNELATQILLQGDVPDDFELWHMELEARESN